MQLLNPQSFQAVAAHLNGEQQRQDVQPADHGRHAERNDDADGRSHIRASGLLAQVPARVVACACMREAGSGCSACGAHAVRLAPWWRASRSHRVADAMGKRVGKMGRGAPDSVNWDSRMEMMNRYLHGSHLLQAQMLG